MDIYKLVKITIHKILLGFTMIAKSSKNSTDKTSSTTNPYYLVVNK